MGEPLQFYTLAFVVFVALSLAVYFAVGRYVKRGQWVVLLVASCVFYAISGWQNIAFIATTALSTWAGGLAFAHFEAQSRAARKKEETREAKKAVKKRFTRKKRLVLALMLLVNFGILSYIKYADVLVGYLAPDSGWHAGILLPLGISFYTFQSIGYVIDTYNAKYDPERNFAKYLLFVSFFPQLIQGPINRFDALATQLFELHSFDALRTRRALLRIGYGALKKYAIADITVKTVDAVFGNIDAGMPGSAIVIGILLYSIYQYADFSGGIDIAIGCAQLFGVEMSENFRQPYFSVSLGDFWRRWHITLGTWMRDYVFYPFALLPGVQQWGRWLTKHCGRHIGRTLPASVANIIVFFLVGLWHGAESHFILWGLYNGFVIAASDMLSPLWNRMNALFHVNMDGAAHRVFCIVRTFIVVNIGWFFDRVEDPGDLLTCFHNVIFAFSPDLAMPQLAMLSDSAQRYAMLLVLACCTAVFVVSVLKERGVDVAGKVLSAPVIVRAILYAFIVVTVGTSFMFAPAGGFLYANF